MGKKGVIGLYLPVLLGPTTLFAAALGHCCVLALWKAWVLGAAAVEALKEGQRNVMVGLKNGELVYTPFCQALSKTKSVKQSSVELVKMLSI